MRDVVADPDTRPPAVAKPTAPFTPRWFSVTGPKRATTTSRPKGPKFGPELIGANGEPLRDAQGRAVRGFLGWDQQGKTRVCWDLRIHCDGHRWFDRYYAAGQAAVAKDQLQAGYAKGLLFDPATKRFMDPASQPVSRAVVEPSVFSESLAWWRTHWTTIEPKSRKETLRYISLPILDFVLNGADAPLGLDDYLSWQMLPPKPADAPIPEEHRDAAAWLKQASLPVKAVDAAMWSPHRSLEDQQPDGPTARPVQPHSPPSRRPSGLGMGLRWQRAARPLADPQDPDTVVGRWAARFHDPAGRPHNRPCSQSGTRASQRVRSGSFGPLAEVYVLLLGIAGGRPGESLGVEVADLDLTSDQYEVRFRRTNRRGIDPLFLDADDDADWGPLKGREIEDTRTVPIPARDGNRIQEVLLTTGVTDALFAGWDRDNFCRDVWEMARREFAAKYAHRGESGTVNRKEAEALCTALGRLRLHNLRHAACSMWLNTPGVEVKVACEWSGHKRLSVFLDIYQGLMPGAKSSAAAKLNSTW